jgi:hypothetical protein
MKNETRPVYTAREVIEILERARELGVTFMRLEGFEASWEPQTTPARAEASAAREREANGLGRCDGCGGPLSPSKVGGDPYCVPCFIEVKEAKKRRAGTRANGGGR